MPTPSRSSKPDTTTGGSGQLAQQAADSIRDLIRRGDLLPGEKVRQVAIAELVGVSRSPLREALRTLEADGVLKYETNRGYVVNRLRMDELAEIFRLRILLENEMMTEIKEPDAEVIRRLEDHLAKMEAAIDADDFTSLTSAYREFHVELYRLSGLPVFLSEVERLWKMTDSYNAMHTLPPDIAKRIVRDHLQIIKALKAGNLVRAREIVAAQPQVNEHVVVGLPHWNRPSPGRAADRSRS
jgi:DNA-binding GntR family transcriptional regulator